MSAFRDVYLPDAIRGFPFTSSPRTSTTITQVADGDEHRNINWKHPLHHFAAPQAVKCMDDVEDLRDHWLVMQGPAFTFPFRDPFDFASRRLQAPNDEPTVGIADQVIGIGDGVTRSFQLQKTYSRGGFTHVRPIFLPVLGSVVVGINGLPADTADPALPGGPYTFDVTRYGGTILFDHAPHVGEAITAGYLFDVVIRFESDDSLDAVVQAYRVSGFADLSFWEVRFCDDGVTT
jgi:uncharacterized protein (TIGR02217 family)